MAQHSFAFPPEASGLAVTVRNSEGATVATDTLGTSDDFLVLNAELPWGQFYTATTDTGGFTAQGEVQEEPGGVGASETAYFVATGPASADTAANDPTDLIWEADSRHGALPAWASIDGSDNIALDPDEVGTYEFSFVGTVDFDFSATTPQTSGGNLSNGFSLAFDATTVSMTGQTVAGDGTDAQQGPTDRTGGVQFASAISASAFPLADDVPDGVGTPRAALTVTRTAQAAVLPD